MFPGPKKLEALKANGCVIVDEDGLFKMIREGRRVSPEEMEASKPKSKKSSSKVLEAIISSPPPATQDSTKQTDTTKSQQPQSPHMGVDGKKNSPPVSKDFSQTITYYPSYTPVMTSSSYIESSSLGLDKGISPNNTSFSTSPSPSSPKSPSFASKKNSPPSSNTPLVDKPKSSNRVHSSSPMDGSQASSQSDGPKIPCK